MIFIFNGLTNNFKINSLQKLFFLVILSTVLTACTTMNLNVSNRVVLPAELPIVVGPLANHSDTPLANRQVESMLTGYLQSKGFRNITSYPRQSNCEKLLYCADETLPNSKLLAWGRAHHVAFILTGAVNEWRYKVGLDGEPVGGVSLLLLNVKSGKTIWTGVGSIIGGSRSGLDVVGQQLLQALLASFNAVC